jgi:4-hydroxybenzoate polyprenyltransferase
MLSTVRKLLSLIRFSHTLFALPFALLAAVMAWGVAGRADRFGFLVNFRWQEFVGILLGMVFARSSAMAFNRLADRTIDAANPRTAARHLPRGDLGVSQVTSFAMLCSVAFVTSTLLFLPNWLPLYLAVPVLLFLLAYSYTKRFTALSHFWLGMALALSPVAAWIAIRGDVVMQHLLDLLPSATLGLAVLSWVAGFDIIYACQDVEFDRQAKLRSIPARFGVPHALRLAAACHLVTILALAALPFVYPFGMIFWLAVAAVAALLIYEHALIRPDDLTRVNVAFFNVNAVISLGLFAVGTLDLWLRWRR